jgi:uncharacterized protein YeaO (DUF488 family)
MAVAVKRVYDPASSADGVRVLVDRLWPRGLSKEHAAIKFWLRDLAPSNELRKWFHANPQSWSLFRNRYQRELASPEASAALGKLYDLAATRKNVTLLYASRNEDNNNATVLKELLEGGRKPPSSIGHAPTGRHHIRKTKKQ